MVRCVLLIHLHFKNVIECDDLMLHFHLQIHSFSHESLSRFSTKVGILSDAANVYNVTKSRKGVQELSLSVFCYHLFFLVPAALKPQNRGSAHRPISKPDGH